MIRGVGAAGTATVLGDRPRDELLLPGGAGDCVFRDAILLTDSDAVVPVATTDTKSLPPRSSDAGGVFWLARSGTTALPPAASGSRRARPAPPAL